MSQRKKSRSIDRQRHKKKKEGMTVSTRTMPLRTGRRCLADVAASSVLVLLLFIISGSFAFTVTPLDGLILRKIHYYQQIAPHRDRNKQPIISYVSTLRKTLASSSEDLSRVRKASEDDVPIPFLDRTENSFIECYADSIITVKGIEYTIGIPCDYCVALCYFDENKNLLPIELNDDLMDDVFSFAENIVSEEFEEELSLQRTPQTLTLVGELEEDEDDDEDGDFDFDEDGDDEYNGKDEVELLITFDHRGKEYNLVRLLDPVLMVGKVDPERPDLRLLLTPEESESVMPILENSFLRYHDDGDSVFP